MAYPNERPTGGPLIFYPVFRISAARVFNSDREKLLVASASRRISHLLRVP